MSVNKMGHMCMNSMSKLCNISVNNMCHMSMNNMRKLCTMRVGNLHKMCVQYGPSFAKFEEKIHGKCL